jgi:hypothetical protein
MLNQLEDYLVWPDWERYLVPGKLYIVCEQGHLHVSEREFKVMMFVDWVSPGYGANFLNTDGLVRPILIHSFYEREKHITRVRSEAHEKRD